MDEEDDCYYERSNNNKVRVESVSFQGYVLPSLHVFIKNHVIFRELVYIDAILMPNNSKIMQTKFDRFPLEFNLKSTILRNVTCT